MVGAPWRELTFVELVTDEGLVGLGEARMVNKTETLVACFARARARGMSSAAIRSTSSARLEHAVRRVRPAGEVAQTALSIFDVACWDSWGSRWACRSGKLLGGCFHDRIPAYANGWYQAERKPEAFAELAPPSSREATARSSSTRSARPTPSCRTTSAAVESTSCPRSATRSGPTGDHGRDARPIHRRRPRRASRRGRAVPARVDRGAGAPRESRGAAAGASRDRPPIATGERVHANREFRELFETGCIDIVQADLTHFGGFLPMNRRLAGWADAHTCLMAPHNVCGPVGDDGEPALRGRTPTTRCSSTSTTSRIPG